MLGSGLPAPAQLRYREQTGPNFAFPGAGRRLLLVVAVTAIFRNLHHAVRRPIFTLMEHWKYPCPCCGYQVFRQQPGNHEKCPICLWEDDLAQLRFPYMPGSSNRVSLQQAQHNYALFGTAERRNIGGARGPLGGEARDEFWRPIDPSRDNVEEPQHGVNYADSYPLADTTVLYYWRPTYWRRLAS